MPEVQACLQGRVGAATHGLPRICIKLHLKEYARVFDFPGEVQPSVWPAWAAAAPFSSLSIHSLVVTGV